MVVVRGVHGSTGRVLSHRGPAPRWYCSGIRLGTTVVGRRGSWTSFTVHRARPIKDGDAATGSTCHAALLSLGLGRTGATVPRRDRVPRAATVLARRDAGCADRLVALAVGDHPAGASSREGGQESGSSGTGRRRCS